MKGNDRDRQQRHEQWQYTPAPTSASDAEVQGGGQKGRMEQNNRQERVSRDPIQKDPNTLETLVTIIITKI
jgi:hypothetical protein